MTVAEEFTLILKRKDMTVTDLSKKVGIPQPTLSRRFKKDDFKLTEIEAIANALDYDMEIIFKKRENKE